MSGSRLGKPKLLIKPEPKEPFYICCFTSTNIQIASDIEKKSVLCMYPAAMDYNIKS